MPEIRNNFNISCGCWGFSLGVCYLSQLAVALLVTISHAACEGVTYISILLFKGGGRRSSI